MDKELLDNFDIEYYLQREAISYKKTYGSSGTQLNVRTCPFCGQSKWKVYINADTGLGNCFSGSCQRKFNKFGFVKAIMQTENNSEVYQTINSVCKELGWIPKQIPAKPIVNIIGQDKLQLPQNYPLPFPDGGNLEYLARRGIDGYYTRLFDLRYCEKGEWKFNTADGPRTQVFQKRIIIPIRDLDGNLVAFQGRDITGLAPNKYQFPSQVAATGKLLYNGHNVIGMSNIVVNEGVFDVIATQMALDKSGLSGEYGVVGSFGKHLTINPNGDDDQLSRFLKLKKQGLANIVMMWDGEPQAFIDAVEASEQLKRYGFNVKVATLPAGKDPNEVYYTEIIDAIKNAKPCTSLTLFMDNPYAV